MWSKKEKSKYSEFL